MNEVRQQAAGLLGALVVRDPGTVRSTEDHVFFIKGSRNSDAANPLEINGSANPDTVVLHVGQPARLRFMSLATTTSNATVSLTTRADSAFEGPPDPLIVRWRPLAKDGADLPPTEQVIRTARQIVGMGETFDFEYTPTQAGAMRLEVRNFAAPGTLYVRVPIVVK